MVSEAVAERLRGRYEFGQGHVVDLKGKGPTTVRFLLARVADHGRPAEVAVPATS